MSVSRFLTSAVETNESSKSPRAFGTPPAPMLPLSSSRTVTTTSRSSHSSRFIKFSAVSVGHANNPHNARIAADAKNTKLWFWIPEGDIDHAYAMANPAGPRKRPRLSAMLYSPPSLPRMLEDTMVVDPMDNARTILCWFGARMDHQGVRVEGRAQYWVRVSQIVVK